MANFIDPLDVPSNTFVDPYDVEEAPARKKEGAGSYLGKKFTQGALQVASAVPLLAGGVAGAFGADETRDELFNTFEGMNKASKDVELGVGTRDEEQGRLARYAGIGVGAVPSLMGFAVNPASGIVTSMLPSVSDAGENIDQGLSTKVALANLGVDAVANVVGTIIPGGVGKTLVKRVATGAGANVALGAVGDQAKASLTKGENIDLASKYDPGNIESRVVDALFGAAAGASQQRATPKQAQLKVDDILASLDLGVPKVNPEVSKQQFGGELKVRPDPNDSAIASQMAGGLSLEPLPFKDPVKQVADDGTIEWEQVDPGSLKESQSELPLNQMDSIEFKNQATPQQGVDFVETIPTDTTNPNKAMPTQLDLLGINVPLGQSRSGKGQRGSIDFGVFSKPKTIEEQAKTLNVNDWSKEFIKKYPQYQDRPEIAAQVYQRLIDPTTGKANLKETLQAKGLVKDVDTALGVVSTRVGNISQPVLHGMIRYEKDLLQQSHRRISQVDEFLTDVNSFGDNTKGLLDNLLLNNNTEGLNRVFDQIGKPELKAKYEQVRKVLDDVGEELVKVGRVTNLRKDYFPRIVKDVDGLKAYLGSDNAKGLEVRLDEARKKAISKGQYFGPVEESAIVNSYLKNRQSGSKPGFAKERKIDEVAPDLEKFYASPTEGLHTYLRNATTEIETAKFFGKNAVKDPETGKINIEKSIGELTAKELREGNMDGNQAAELESIIKSRFGPGNQSAPGWQQDVKNVINMGLLGNVISSVTQGGDIAAAAYLNGIRPALMSLVGSAAGRNRISMKDFGLIDHISEEFLGQRSSAKVLNKIFKVSAFTSVDALGKNTILNSALINAERSVKTPVGEAKFKAKWGERFGDEFPDLVADLKAGKRSELTDMLVFSELSKIQPVTKLEVPQAYLDMPKGRIVYMLKSFMIKQIDLVRRDAYNEIKKGTKEGIKTGLTNIMRYSVIMGMAGATTSYMKDFLLYGLEGVDPELSDIPLNVLKTFGWSEYVNDKIKQGKVGEALGDIALPPYKMFDVLFSEAKKELDMDDETEASGKAYKFIPVVGRLLESWFTESGENKLEAKKNKTGGD